MPKSATGPAVGKRRKGGAMLSDQPLAAFGHHPRKTLPFVTMLAVLVTVGIVGLVQTGIAQGWGMALLLIGLPGVLLASYIRDLLLKGPLLILTREGLIDRRRGPDPIPWEAIAEATAKNRLFAKGVRLVLTNGERMEIDLSLLDAEPKDIILIVHKMAAESSEAG